MSPQMHQILLTMLFNNWLTLLREKKYDELKADLEFGLKALKEEEND